MTRSQRTHSRVYRVYYVSSFLNCNSCTAVGFYVTRVKARSYRHARERFRTRFPRKRLLGYVWPGRADYVAQGNGLPRYETNEIRRVTRLPQRRFHLYCD